MTQIFSIHSFRGGTGKSNITANLATTVAGQGKRVAIIDTDIQSPGIHVLFGMVEEAMQHSLNDYLWSKCSITEAAYNVTPPSVATTGGSVFLIPCSIKAGEIARILNEGYSVMLLNEGLKKLCVELNLDFLFIDTHPGLNKETLLSFAISNALLIILRPDSQDFQGTAVTLQVAQKLDTPRTCLIVNKVLSKYDPEAVREQVSQKFKVPVAGVFPVSEEMIDLGSKQLFSLVYQDHPFTVELKRVAKDLMAS
jgi:MinD-like ATPase involved in chromosome partitioning or flagellar assembly